MFENVLFQDRLTSLLRRGISESALPPSVLFSGLPYSGKLTAALELVRALSCARDGEWNCPCKSCESHRALAHPGVILAGSREVLPEISAAADVLRQSDSDAARYLMIRSARRLLLRFDTVLWEGEESKISKIRPATERLAEHLNALLPGQKLPAAKKFSKMLDTMVDDCALVQKALPGALPVGQVRRIVSWAHHSSSEKYIIIDAAERMADSARNALLKFLEEPPANTMIVLTTGRKSLLLPTIVSRLRDYAFMKRSPQQEAEVLRRVFRAEEPQTLNAWFTSRRSGAPEEIQNAAAGFLRNEYPQGLISDKDDLITFLECLTRELQNNPPSAYRQAAMQAGWIRQARFRAESLNLPVRLILRSLFSAMGTGR